MSKNQGAGGTRRTVSSTVSSTEGNMAITASSYMIAGILVYGGLGWEIRRC